MLVYFAVSKLGEKPIDGKTDVNPEGLTAAYGKHAAVVAERLAGGDLSCKVWHLSSPLFFAHCSSGRSSDTVHVISIAVASSGDASKMLMLCHTTVHCQRREHRFWTVKRTRSRCWRSSSGSGEHEQSPGLECTMWWP